MTRTEVAQVLAYLVSAWPTVDIGDETAAIWVDQLGNVAMPDGEAAARKLVASSKWFPSPAEFLEQAQAEARSRRAHEHALPPAPAVVEPGKAPSCPRCQHRDHIERLNQSVMGHGWLCGTCWTTFAGTSGEWDQMARARHAWATQQANREDTTWT